MQVSEVMHQGVTTAQIGDSLKKVAALMKRHDIGAVPVYKNERPVGFVTDRDIVVSCVASGHSPEDPVSLAMSREVFFIKAKQEIHEAAKLMEQQQISRLLVVDDSEQPIGMLTLRDICLRANDESLTSEIINLIKRG